MSDCRLVPILVILSLYCVGTLYSNFDLNFEFIYSNNNFWRSFIRYFLDDSVFSLLRLIIFNSAICFSIFYDNMFLISFKFYLYFTKPIENQELVLLVYYVYYWFKVRKLTTVVWNYYNYFNVYLLLMLIPIKVLPR